MTTAATMTPTSAARRVDAQASSGPKLRIAYLTTEYPKVSHTFIRREILELERRGHQVLRLAIRGAGGAVADAADRDEAQRTIVCLNLPKVRMLGSIVRVQSRNPLRWLRGLTKNWRMSRASERGLLRHLAYLYEASVLLRICERENINHVHVHFGTNSAAVARLMHCLSGGRLSTGARLSILRCHAELRFLRRRYPPTASIGRCSLRSASGRVFAHDGA